MFKWNETYALGIAEIDEQHQQLFQIGNDLYYLLNLKDRQISLEEMNLILGQLRDYALYHFKTEENYFEAFGYENSETHIAEHGFFMEKLNEIEFGMGTEPEIRQAMTMLKLVIDWVFKHIHGSDFQYKSCFITHLEKGKTSV